jgi:CHAT domain
VSVLPSVASLKALRVFGSKGQAAKPLVGFGDPIFNPENQPDAKEKITVASRSYPEFWKGLEIDRGMLRGLPRLPETADELKAVAAKLGASTSDIHLQKDASETSVKRARLAEYNAVYFATHGLVAGDVKGLGEPALALSIPKLQSELDDGLLTASEVAQLKLNADLGGAFRLQYGGGRQTGRGGIVGTGPRLLLCRGSCAARLALGGRKQSRDDTHDLNVRSYQIRSQARPRRGAAARHARLHERCYGPAQCLSGAVGTLCGGWRRSCEVRGQPVPIERSSELPQSSATGSRRLIPDSARSQPLISPPITQCAYKVDTTGSIMIQ